MTYVREREREREEANQCTIENTRNQTKLYIIALKNVGELISVFMGPRVAGNNPPEWWIEDNKLLSLSA